MRAYRVLPKRLRLFVDPVRISAIIEASLAAVVAGLVNFVVVIFMVKAFWA